MSDVLQTVYQQIRNQLSSAFGGNPNSLDVTLFKLRESNLASAFNLLFQTLVSFGPTLTQIEAATGGAPSGDLDQANLLARINKIRANSIGALQSLALSAMPASESLFNEVNNGAKLTTLPNGDVFGLYVPGNTRRLTWNATTTRPKYAYVNGKVTRIGSVTTTNTVWSDGSGPLVSCLAAASLNLSGGIVGATALADEVAQLQAVLWSVSEEVENLPGTVNLGRDTVPTSIIKQYPKGYLALYDIDGKLIA